MKYIYVLMFTLLSANQISFASVNPELEGEYRMLSESCVSPSGEVTFSHTLQATLNTLGVLFGIDDVDVDVVYKFDATENFVIELNLTPSLTCNFHGKYNIPEDKFIYLTFSDVSGNPECIDTETRNMLIQEEVQNLFYYSLKETNNSSMLYLVEFGSNVCGDGENLYIILERI